LCGADDGRPNDASGLCGRAADRRTGALRVVVWFGSIWRPWLRERDARDEFALGCVGADARGSAGGLCGRSSGFCGRVVSERDVMDMCVCVAQVHV
jgi:hypothetical protein